MDAVQEIKAKLNIEDVVSEYVQLKRAGRNFKGLSPFTNEKSPSFIVSPEKQIWHDFSSGRGGDMISFIEAVEGLDFKGSLELLARKAGVDLTQFKRSPSGDRNAKYKARLFEAVEVAVLYYQKQLLINDAPLRYLREKRGYEKQTILDFRFGYSPHGRDTLAVYMRSKGYTDQELTKAGLCVNRDGNIIDMFRGRVMVPLSDAQGRPVGFTARQLNNDSNSPKYINTPATVLYDKSRQLYGMSMAKEHIRKNGYVVVVEGNLDVVASHQAGVGQVVASAGTALTTYHLKTLQRFTGDIRLAFDDDRAGQEAAQRTIPIAQGLGLDMSIISIPAGKDPDELIKQDVQLWQQTVDQPQYMIDWLMEKLAASLDITSAKGKRQYTTMVSDILKSLSDEVEREHYLRRLAEQTGVSYQTMLKKFTAQKTADTPRLKKVRLQNADEDDAEIASKRKLQQHYLSILQGVPDHISRLEGVPDSVFDEQGLEYLQATKRMTDMTNGGEYAKLLSVIFEETYQHTDASELEYQLEKLIARLIRAHITIQKRNILRQLDAPESAEHETELLQQVQKLEQLRNLYK